MIERCIFVICLDKKCDPNFNKMPPNRSQIKLEDLLADIGDDEQDQEERNVEEEKVNGHSCDVNSKIGGSGSESSGDDDEQQLDPLEQMTLTAFQMLHGCNSQNNSGNRWFDKTMQFIISDDGTCGLNYEHSPSEGIAVIELSEHLFRYMEEKRKQKLYRMPSICELPTPRKLRWKISDRVKKWIEYAKQSFDK